MTKILQLRRGTRAQHDTFIGMDGEITVDTNTQTIHVHDAVTPGGVPLARADMSNIDRDALGAMIGDIVTPGDGNGGTGGGFDINSVTAEFWDALFREHNIRSSHFALSSACSIISAPYAEYIFDIDGATFNPTTAIADTVIVCQTGDGGYAAGDVVYAFGIGNRAGPRPHVFADANGVHVRQLINAESFWVSHKTTGAQTAIDTSKWKIVFRVWY